MVIKGDLVNIELLKGVHKEFIVKDRLGITLGRINIIELSKDNKYCCARLKFYKEGINGIEYLKETLQLFITSLFKEMNIFKINLLVDEEISTRPFVDLGFTLEGFVSDSNFYNGIHKSEILFGINYDIFSNLNRINILRLYGQNVDLKILTVENASDMLEYYKRNKEHLKQYEPTREESFYSLPAQRQILIENYKQFLNGTGANFGIFKEKVLIGKVQISGIIFGVFKSGVVGYSIDKDEQGKGYMKEALNLVLEYAFSDMDLHRIEASTLVDNIRSQAVLRGCEFNELGLNKNYLFINGQWRDHFTFYKTKED